MQGKGPAEAFRLLESKLPGLRGRRFYGAIHVLEGRPEEYYACVERDPGDDPTAMAVEEGVLPGGLYVRRKLTGWKAIVDAGQLPSIGREMAQLYSLDPTRPELEFYRSMEELHLLLPVTDRKRRPTPSA